MPVQDDTTLFHFDFGGVRLELSGEREFVERLYQVVMRDVEAARKGVPLEGQGGSAGGGRRLPVPGAVAGSGVGAGAGVLRRPAALPPAQVESVVWVQVCGEWMRKVYMTSTSELTATLMSRALHPERVNVLFIDKSAESALPAFDVGKTMWAELTEQGKKRIADAQSLASVPSKG